jgi:DNA-3-methyladenine glycosylase I
MSRPPTRCPWCGTDPGYVAYHDDEWGVPVHEERQLFEFLILETFQAGLSWLTILRKRDNFRRAFARFDPSRVARFTDADIARLMDDAGIVRNRAKIEAAVVNARAFLDVQDREGGFDPYIWGFTGGRPVINRWRRMDQVPAVTPLAETISRDLKSRGFKFVGPTVIYAHMQATGMVNDHLTGCYRHRELRDAWA